MFKPEQPVPKSFAAAPGAIARKAAFGLSDRAIVIAVFVVVSVVYFYAAISRSVADHLWMDEVLAVSAARQPSLAAIWHAIWNGTDFSPPTYHALLHGLVKTVGGAGGRLVWRVPSIVAVYGAALCTYLLLLKSSLGRSAALLGFAIVPAFGLFAYAVQARQYALLAFGLAAALLLWRGMDDQRGRNARAFGLWFVLAACLCLHFYGIVEVAAIGTAELIYWITRKRFRIAVWAALALTAAVEVALYPLASHLAAFNSGDSIAPAYYAKPTLQALLGAVYQLIDGGRFGTLLLLSTIAMMAAARLADRSGPRPARAGQNAGLSELEMAMISLCMLPLFAFAFSLFVTKSFSARYMAAAALLPAIAVPYVLDKLTWRQVAPLALLPLAAGVLVLRAHAPDPVAAALAVLEQEKPSAPVVVGEGLLYIELMEAADAQTRSELVYLKRPAGSSSPDPTNENEVIRLASFHPEYRVSGETAFLEDHERFYLLSRPGMSTDTTTPALINSGKLGGPAYAKGGVILFRSVASEMMQANGSSR